MAEFKDINGKSWIIAYDRPKVEAIQEVMKYTVTHEDDTQEVMGINIVAEDGSGLAKIGEEGFLIVQACWILCQKQAQAAGVTEEQFGEAMADGTVIEAAEKAMRDALVNFTRPSRRDALTRVLSSQDSVTKKTMEALAEKVEDPETLEAILDATRARMDGTLAKILSRLSEPASFASDTPATLESTTKGKPSEA